MSPNDTGVLSRTGACAAAALAVLTFIGASCAQSEQARSAAAVSGETPWSHDNLAAWCVVPFDANKRDPEQRAAMLARLGFKHFAYDWREEDIPTFDAEIEALKKHGVNLLAWWFPLEADNPLAKETLETFKRHNVHPQLWVMLEGKDEHWPGAPEEWQKWLPDDVHMPRNNEEVDTLSAAEKVKWQQAYSKALARIYREKMPKTQEEQERRVTEYSNRVAALHRLAAPYRVKIGLYNHNGWFGLEENQLAIISRLQSLGITDVGMVYNFSHARDELHDDSKGFPGLWKEIKPHVMAVNITGMRWDGELIYPSQGDSELEMMRTIQQSGWRGPVGLIAEKGGDAEVTLHNYILGLDWLASQLTEPIYRRSPPKL